MLPSPELLLLPLLLLPLSPPLSPSTHQVIKAMLDDTIPCKMLPLQPGDIHVLGTPAQVRKLHAHTHVHLLNTALCSVAPIILRPKTRTVKIKVAAFCKSWPAPPCLRFVFDLDKTLCTEPKKVCTSQCPSLFRLPTAHTATSLQIPGTAVPLSPANACSHYHWFSLPLLPSADWHQPHAVSVGR